MSHHVYLDWNATTPPLAEVIDSMAEVARTAWGNPASVHRPGRSARDVVETAREEIGSWLSVSPRDVIFTSGGTEANNLALHAASALVTSELEHPSVTRMAEVLEAAGRPVRWLPVSPSGRLDPASVGEALEGLPARAVVAVAAANHETGVIQPLAEIAAIVARSEARLHVDAVQVVGKLPCDLLAVADTLALAAHKIRWPKGIGALVHRPERAPRPLLVGGSQERGRRPGTVDPAAAAGFRVAVAWARQSLERLEPQRELRDRLEAELVRRGARVHGAEVPRLGHVSNLAFEAHAGDELVAALDLLGVAVSSGSACSAGSSEPSKVLSAMLGVERARRALRISLGETTTRADIDWALQAFDRVLRA